MRRMRRLLASLFLACLAGAAPAAESQAELLALLKSGGQAVLMRHTATPPGVGDPPGMSLDDCATQRNLTDQGRADARAIGERLRKAGIAFDHVEASPLCRCKETARLAFGRVDELQPATTRGDREVRELRAFVSEKRRGNGVLVSHGTTIRNAVGVDAEPGDLVVLTPLGDGRYEVRGKLSLLRP
jgi:broad specificity phosphatase PhoE